MDFRDYFRDRGTEGQRDEGTEGQRDEGTEGQKDEGTEGRRDGGTGITQSRQSQSELSSHQLWSSDVGYCLGEFIINTPPKPEK